MLVLVLPNDTFYDQCFSSNTFIFNVSISNVETVLYFEVVKHVICGSGLI